MLLVQPTPLLDRTEDFRALRHDWLTMWRGMIVCACLFCITALDRKIVGRWNALDNFFGAV
jgi:hypothetical protein